MFILGEDEGLILKCNEAFIDVDEDKVQSWSQLKPVSQSSTVARSDKFWWATQGNQTWHADRMEVCSTGQSAVQRV